jgi:L-ribulokinase
VETLRDGGVEVDRFVATGGLARQNTLFVEIIASVLDAPVAVSQVDHGPALGAAVLGAVAAGRFADAADAVRSMTGQDSEVPAARIVDPEPDDVKTYLALARCYRQSAERLARETRESHP